MKRVVALLTPILMAGCVSIQADGTGKAHYYFGLVKVMYPVSRGRLTAIDVKSIGVGFDGAAFVGWRDSKFVYADAADCRTVIILRDKSESDHVVGLLKSLGDKACIADFAGSLSPR
jgi:hypothetical protein